MVVVWWWWGWWVGSELWHPSWQGEDVLHCQAQQEGYRGDQTRPGHPIHRENYQFKNNKWFLFIRCPIIQFTHGSHPVWTDERQKGFSLLWRASNIGVEHHTSSKPNPTELSAILDFTSKYCIICTYWEAVSKYIFEKLAKVSKILLFAFFHFLCKKLSTY